MKKGKGEKSSSENEPHPPRFNKLIRNISDTVSESYVKSLIGFKDYIYEINYTKYSKLQKINSKFHRHSKLYLITFPPSLKTIGSSSFSGMNYLFQIQFLKNDDNENFLETIEDRALKDTDIDTITMPINIVNIGSNCFPKCLKAIEFEKGAPKLQNIGNTTFSKTQLESFKMPLNITPFLNSRNVFLQCHKLNELIFDSYINKDELPTIKPEDEESKINNEIEFTEKTTTLLGQCKDEEESNAENESTLDLANNFLISQIPTLKTLEVFTSNLNHFHFFNTPNLTSIKTPKSGNGGYIKNKGCLYTKDKKKLIVAERNIKTTTILANCQVISNYALNVKSLEKVSFEKNSELQEISWFAFAESYIKNLTIPDSVCLINYGAFYNCTKLESINIPSSLNTLNYATFSFSNLKEIKITKNITKIRFGCFYKCSQLSKIEFENDSVLEGIEDYAFYGTNINSILIPKSVKKIGDYCFMNCNKLKKIEFQNDSNLTEFGKGCFKGTEIEDFQLPQKIEKYDLSKTKVKTVNLSNCSSLNFIGNFMLSAITLVSIPPSVTEIQSLAFLDCVNLTKVEIIDLSNSKLETIGKEAFSNCSSLTEFEMPKTVNFFGFGSFKNCSKLITQISIENDKITVCKEAFSNSGITAFQSKALEINIGESAFKNCGKLSLFSAEAELSLILSSSSFEDCSSLTDVKLNPSTEKAKIDENCFMNSSIKAIEIPNSLTVIPKSCFKNCRKLAQVTIQEESQLNLFEKEAFYKSGVKSILIPSKTEIIEESCFEDCSHLKKLIFSKNLQKCLIKERAFYNSGIQQLSITKAIENIEISSFEKCTKLKKVTFSDDLSFKKIEDNAFQSTAIENLTIPATITSIGKSSFCDCKNLKSVTFRGDNIYIDQFAFSGCENIQTVKCKDQIKFVPARSTEILNQYPLTVQLKQEQIDETVIKSLLVSPTPYFQELHRINLFYSLVFDMPLRFTTLIDCYMNEYAKCKIIEYKNGGYYSNLMQKLMFCDSSIDEIKVSKDTKVIKSNAFKYSKLKKIEFEENSILRTIKNHAFELLQITEISIPDSVTSIGHYAFSDCYYLSKVVINTSSNLITIGESAFAKTAIDTIVFPPTLKTVSDYAFYECFNLKQVENYSNDIVFKQFSFYNSAIEEINFPGNCIFESSAFKKCMNLKQLFFENESEKVVFGIDSFAFSGVEEIVIKCIATVDEGAFYSCNFLKKITIDSQEILISKDSIKSPNIESCSLNLKLDSQVYSPYFKDILMSKIDKCKLNLSFANFDYEKFQYKNRCFVYNNTLVYADLIDNIALTREYRSESNRRQIKKNEILHVPSCVKKLDFNIISHLRMIVFSKKCSVEDLGPPRLFSYYNLIEITIPKLVQSISPFLFEHCHYLRTVRFEEGSILKEIGEYSFSNTRVRQVELPSTVQIIHKAAFSNNLDLKEVTFEGETIEEEAFLQTGLTTFTLSNNTKIIGDKAFQYCHSLTTFTIDIENSTLSEIGSDAFLESAITSINIPSNVKVIKSFTFSGCQSLTTINVSTKSKLEKIEEDSFSTNPSLTKINIPKKVSNLFSDIFVKTPSMHAVLFENNQHFCIIENKDPYKCTIMLNFAKGNTKNSLTNNCYVIENELVYANMIDNAKLYIKPSQEEIEEPTKRNEVLIVPANAKKLNFPLMSHIKRIRWSAANVVEDLGSPGSFSYYNLVQITIPKSVQSIPPHMFENCHHLTTLLFEPKSTLKEIGEYSFSSTRIVKVELPSSVQIIHKAAFSNNFNLKEVAFEGETIEEEAFSQTGLTTFTLSNNTKTIGDKAFQYCHSLTTLSINIDCSTLSEIGSHAFSETAITSINIPPHLKVIKPFTFSGCRSLNKVNISSKSKLEQICEFAFSENLSLNLINIPTTLKKLSHEAFINTPSLKSIMAESNECFNVLEDYSVYASDRTLVFVPRYLKQFKVIENCLIIHGGAFCGPNLETVTFSDNSLKCIEKHAFAFSSGFKSITIPNSIQIIGEEAFVHCEKLETVEFDPESQIAEIPKFCFAFSGLKTIKLPTLIEVINQSSFFFCNDLKEVNLDAIKIKYIGDFAFSVTGIEEVKLPSSIKFIGSHAFDNNKSLKLVDLSKLNKIEETDRLNVKDFLKQFLKSRKKLMREIVDTIKRHSLTPNEIDEHNEVIRNEVQPIDLNPPPEDDNKNNKSPRRKPKFNSKKIALNGSPYLMLKDVPRVFKPNPYINKKVTKIKPPMVLSNNEPLPSDNLAKKKATFVLQPSDQKNNISPRRMNNKKGKENIQKVNYSSIMKQESFEEEYSQDFTENNEISVSNENEIIVGTPSPKCYIHKTAFEHAYVSTFRCNFDTIEWFSFFENCAKISKLVVNPNIRFRLQKLGKENTDGVLNGSMFRISKIQFLNQETVPVLSHQLLKEFLVPKQAKSMNSYSFAFCEKLNKITFDEGNNIQLIPEFCFAYSSLSEIVIPLSVESIDKYAFYQCYNLEKVHLLRGNKLNTIQEGAFCECKKLESIHISKSVERIGKYAFMSCTSLQKVSFSENCILKTIDEYAFSECKNLSSIKLPDTVEFIGKDCFSFTGLKNIQVPPLIKIINCRTFYNCEELNKVELFEGLEEIGTFSFCKDLSLKVIQLPDSVRRISSNAFFDCNNLRKLKTTTNTQLVELFEGSIEHTKIEEITINRSARVLFAPRNVNRLKRINFSGGPPEYFIQKKDGCIYEKTTEFDHFFDTESDISDLESKIRDSISNDFAKSIYYYQHKMRKNSLLSIRLEKAEEQRKMEQITKELIFRRNRSKYSDKIIDKHPVLRLVFAPKDLKTLVIHEDCFNISDSIFDGMTNLNSIEYKKGITNSIKEFRHYNHKNSSQINNITTIKISGQFIHLDPFVFKDFSTLERVEISEQSNISYIPKGTFCDCIKLREITIPSTCFSIEESAFKNCTSLTSFVIRKVESSEQQLRFIRKEAFFNCTSLECIMIPSTVYAICEKAFMNCMNLSLVEFEESENIKLRIIEKNAFKNCRSISSFHLPSSCTTVGPAAFMNCINIKTFEYDGTELQAIQSRTFLNCISLTRIELLNLNIVNITEEEENEFKEEEEKKEDNNEEEEKKEDNNEEEQKEEENKENKEEVKNKENKEKTEEEEKKEISENKENNEEVDKKENIESKETTEEKENGDKSESKEKTEEEEKKENSESKEKTEEEEKKENSESKEKTEEEENREKSENKENNEEEEKKEKTEEEENNSTNINEEEESEASMKRPKSQFYIGAEAFMNCKSLQEVIIEDQSKYFDTILYDENNSPIFVYPPYLPDKMPLKTSGKQFYIRKKSTIQKRAFYNCKSLTNVRFFLENLERFNSRAFENCSMLKTMELNSTFWRFLFTEALDMTAFNGTPEDLEIKLFNNDRYLHLNVDLSSNRLLQQQKQSSSLAKSLPKNKNLANSFDNSKFNNNKNKTFELQKANQQQQHKQRSSISAEIREFKVAENVRIVLRKTENELVSDFSLCGAQYNESKFEWGVYHRSNDSIPFMKGKPLEDFSQMTKLLHSCTFPSNYELTKIIFDDGIQIKSIPNYCFLFTALKEISIPSTVKKIGINAFLSCRNLQTVRFSEDSQLKSIGEGAFSECKKLSSIKLPDTVEFIGKDCFSFTGLKNIQVPPLIKIINCRTFYNCEELNKVELFEGLEEIGTFSFCKDLSLKVIQLPDSVRRISSNAFFDCNNLRKLKTTTNTQLVELFEGSIEHTKIEEITINRSARVLFTPRNVNRLKRINFSGGPPEYFIQKKDGCIYEKTTEFDHFFDTESENLLESEINEPSQLYPLIEEDYFNRIGRNTGFKFKKLNEKEKQCTNLSQRFLIKKNRSKYTEENIDKHPVLRLVFAPKDLKTLVIHEDCFNISDSIFDGMTNLNSIEYKKGITNSIKEFRHYNHKNSSQINNITTIKISGQFIHLDPFVFKDFSTLERVEISEQSNISYIPKGTFCGCIKLREITIPSTCFSIEESAFKNCTSLKKFQIRTKDRDFNQITPQLKFIRKEAFLNCESLEAITIPSSVFAISDSSFMNCTNLEQVQFDDEECSLLEIIEKNAFKNCKSLSAFVLPQNCQTVGPAAFMNCISMKNFEYNGTKLKFIQSRTFYNCKSLTIFKVKNLPYKSNYSTVSIESQNEEEEQQQQQQSEEDEYDEYDELDFEYEDLNEEEKQKLERIRQIREKREKIMQNLKQKEKEKIEFSHPFSIGSQAFMNCTSLRKVIIEDNSKNTKTIEFDQNNSPLLLYPSHDYSKISYHETHDKLTLIPHRQIIARKAFCNCRSLHTVSFFMGNLERIQTEAFKNCSLLRTINTNSQYAAFLFEEGIENGAFNGASETVEVKLFSMKSNSISSFEFETKNENYKENQKLTENQRQQVPPKNNKRSIIIVNSNSETVNSDSDQITSQIRLFSEHLSSLEKTKSIILGTRDFVFKSGRRLFVEFLSSLDKTKPLVALEPETKRRRHRRHHLKNSQNLKSSEISYDELIWSFFKNPPEWINEVVILDPVTKLRYFKSYVSNLGKTLPLFSFKFALGPSEFALNEMEKRHFKYHMMTTSEIMALKYEEQMIEADENLNDEK